MPTYEYQCSACGHELEEFQKMTDEPLKECPQCHKPTLNRLVSATNFQLKGTGWYVTDIRDKGKPKPSAKEDGDKGGSSEASTTSETKKESGTDGSSTNNSSSSSGATST